MSASMAAALHHHDLLQVYVDGQPVTVPSQVGIDQAEGYLTSLHTHDASGIIHVESPTQRSFTLGQFFDVWGVRLTSTCIGSYCPRGLGDAEGVRERHALHGRPADHPAHPARGHRAGIRDAGRAAEPDPLDLLGTSISPSCTGDC